MSSVFAAIAFDPTIRGILICVVSVGVLCGSIYLIVSTNTGPRLGFLISAAGLFGWCFLMGIIWWVYGIGFMGRAPAWHGIEVNFDRTQQLSLADAQTLPPSDELPEPLTLLDKYPKYKADAMADPAFAAIVDSNAEQDRLTLTKVVTVNGKIQEDLDKKLGGWRILPESDSRRGETIAAADGILTSTVGSAATGFASPSAYYVEDVYYFGGKASMEPEPGGAKPNQLVAAWRKIESMVQVKNPPLYAAVTVRAAKVFPDDPSTAPPPPQPRSDVSTVTVLMERDLGNKRAIPAAFTVICGGLFFSFCWLLHMRDKRVMALRAAAG